MKRVYRLFGIPVWSITSDEPDDDDKARDLSGGSTSIERLEVDTATDRFMGFTNGREVS